MCYLGIGLAAYFARLNKKPRKEKRIILGQEMYVNTFHRNWFEQWGDKQIEKLLLGLKKNPTRLNKLPQNIKEQLGL